jgi:hypothetical protein
MRRTATALAVLAASLVLWVAPASGSPAPPERPDHELTGTFAGTSTYEFSSDPACNFVLERYTGTYDPDRRGVPGGTYAMDVCVSFGAPQGFGVDGTFVVTGPRLTLSGTVHGALTSLPDNSGLQLDVTLTVTDSDGRGRPIRGTITATGIRTEPGGGIGTSVESGTFTAGLHRTRGR